MVGWRLSFDARWTWLSNLVVLECVVGERGEMQRSAPWASGAFGWIGSISAAVRAVVSDPGPGDGHAVVFGSGSDSMQRERSSGDRFRG